MPSQTRGGVRNLPTAGLELPTRGHGRRRHLKLGGTTLREHFFLKKKGLQNLGGIARMYFSRNTLKTFAFNFCRTGVHISHLIMYQDS